MEVSAFLEEALHLVLDIFVDNNVTMLMLQRKLFFFFLHLSVINVKFCLRNEHSYFFFLFHLFLTS